MIPYTGFSIINLGPIPIRVWGLLVALGLVAGIIAARWFAKKQKLNPDTVSNLVIWATIGGFIGARLGHIFLYNFPYYRAHPVEMLFVWQGGLSSFGGFIGAFVVLGLWFWKHRKQAWQYAEVLAFSFPLAWGIGRLGCFLTHMHPGVCTNSFLGMNEPSDVCARFDLGLLESIQNFLIFVFFVGLLKLKKPFPRGMFAALLAVLYAVPRFFFDFLRIYEGPQADARYFGLTPAQYGSIVVAAVGVWLFIRLHKRQGEVA
ncbi:MAG: prolipoprotein diacylglyceryl transferase [Patescibacteria group bacterium]